MKRHEPDPRPRAVICLRAEVTTFVPLAVLVAALLQLATRHQAGHRELAAAVFAVLVTQFVPGVLIWRVLRPRDGWLVEDAFLGFACGAALAVPVQVVSVVTAQAWLAWFLPVLVVTALIAVPRARSRIVQAECAPLPRLWGVAVAVPTLVACAAAVRFFFEPLRWNGWAAPYVDLPYHLALAGELSHRWPPQYPQVAGEALHYHWFAHAWIAQVGSVSGTSLDVILLRFMPAVIALAVPAATAAVAIRLTRRVWTGPLAVVFSFAVTELDVWHIARGSLPINPLSPSEGFGVLVMLPLMTLLVLRWRGVAAKGALLAVVPLMVLAGGSKGSVLPVLLAGCLLACVAAVVWRTAPVRRVVLDTFLLGTVLLVLMRVLFGGGTGGMSPTPFTSLAEVRMGSFLGEGAQLGTAGVLLVTVLALCAMVLPVVASFGVFSDHGTRTDPAVWMLIGIAASGYGAVLVLEHPGQSQFYFLRTAVVSIGILAAWGTVTLLSRVQRPAVVAGVGVVAGVAAVSAVRLLFGPVADSNSPLRAATGAFLVFLLLVGLIAVIGVLVVPRTGTPGVLAGLTMVAVAMLAAGAIPSIPTLVAPAVVKPASADSKDAFHSGQVVAARYVRDHSSPDDIVISNRHCRKPRMADCDARRFFVAAYTERRVLVEGWAYTKKANTIGFGTDQYEPRTGPFWKPGLLHLNDRFFTHPTPKAARRLYDLGVRWVFVDHTGPHAKTLEPFAARRFSTGTATVYELTAPTT